jgi:hypothetical protein
MVDARPGGRELAGSIRNTSARAPFVSLSESRHVDVAALILGCESSGAAFLQHSLAPFSLQPNQVSAGWLRFGGEMLLKIALVLLVAWLIEVLGVYDIGDAGHVLLLVGGLLFLLGVLKARDAAAAAAPDANERSRKP